MTHNLQVSKIYSLAPMQEGMLYHSIVTNEPGMYVVQMRISLIGNMDIPVFEESFNRIIERHDIFRTVFLHEGLVRPKQVVLSKRKLRVYFNNLLGSNIENQEEQIEEYIKNERAVKMNLSKDMLISVGVFQTGENSSEVILNFHHIILDGWSLGIILDELFLTYEALLTNTACSYKSIYPFQHYINWIENKGKKEESLLFWKNYLKDYEEKAVIQESWTKHLENTYDRKEEVFCLNEELLQKAKMLSINNKATLSSFIHTIWSIILFQYNHTNDVVFGTVTSGRNTSIDGVGSIVGMLINTVPIRIVMNEKDSFCDLLRMVQKTMLEVELHSYIQLAEIQAVSKLKKGLLHHIIAYENYYNEYAVNNDQDESKLKIINCETSEQTNYDITVKFIPSNQNLTIKIMYHGYKYETEYIKQLGNNIITLIEEVTCDPNKYIKDFSILRKEQKDRIIYEYNDTKKNYSSEKLIHQLFEEQVVKLPSKTAILSKSGSYTYQELNEKSNQLARFLNEKYVKAKSYVAVLLNRSIDMIPSVMSILKAGAVYVPFDVCYPIYRIVQIIQELDIRCIITEHSQKELISDIHKQASCLENIIFVEDTFSQIQNYNADNLPIEITSKEEAYVIYTSGSTGKPKGVAVCHRPVINLIEWVNKTFDVREEDKILFVTSLCFDLSVYDIFGLLAAGGEIYVASEEELSNQYSLLELLCMNQITFWDSAPAAFQQLLPLLSEYEEKAKQSCLKRVFFSGDWIPVTMPGMIQKVFNNARIISLGGATEAVVWSNYYVIDEIDPRWVSIPYGYPIQNACYYILDKELKPCPIGVKGDLYIGGECLASGYAKDEELTKRKFLQNPFLPDENAKMYKTGDMARWTNDGYMEFLGREDFQVKIRGYRIEMGEIEYQLKQLDKISDVIIHAKEDKFGNKFLIAYYICDYEITYSEIKTYLLGKLPDYMIPSYFIQIAEFPVTRNGKLDRKALPDPEDTFTLGNTYAAPENNVQELLVIIWADILGLRKENISIDDDFFELGGHSLLAIRLEVELQKHGLKMPEDAGHRNLVDITTIRNMSYCVKECDGFA